MGACVLDCEEGSYDGGEGQCLPLFETCTENCEGYKPQSFMFSSATLRKNVAFETLKTYSKNNSL